MANNFYVNTDPLLGRSIEDIQKEIDFKQHQLNNYKYSMQNDVPDHYSKLENAYSTLSEDDMNKLLSNETFSSLSNKLQIMIQKEQFNIIRQRLNTNNEAITTINGLIDEIEKYNKNKTIEKDKMMSDFNDYIQNYSDITFAEYKKLKANK